MVGSAAAAGEDAEQRLQSRRLVHLFDFEETIEGARLGRFESLPLHWYAIGRTGASSDPNFLAQPLHQHLMRKPGYSRHGAVHFDDRHVTSGEFSLYAGIDSGSSGAFVQIGTLPAMPEVDYLIQANVRTSDFRHAGARLMAYFVDGQGQRIERSIVTTTPIRTAGQWRQVSVNLSGEFPEAAWIGLQLEVVQPRQDDESPLGEHQLVFREVEGGAWFDDVAIWQVPHIQLRTQSDVNIVRQPHRPRLSMEVRDLTGESLIADVVIYDHAMRQVASQRRPVGAGEQPSWAWTPPLEGLGWYLVDMQLTLARPADDSARQVIARNRLALLWLGEDRAIDPSEAGRFALRAEDLPEAELVMLPELMASSRVTGAIISAWERETTLDRFDRRQALLEQVIHQVVTAGGRLTISLYPLPGELSDHLATENKTPAALFGPQMDFADWSGYLSPLTLRFGQRVDRWQLGPNERPTAFYRVDLPHIARHAAETFTNLAPQPTVILPWRISQSRRSDVESHGYRIMTALETPASIQPHLLWQYTDPWRSDPAQPFRLDFVLPPATEVAHPGRVRDLTLRMLYGWEAGAAGLTLDKPWTLAQDRQTRLTPDPLLGAFTTVSHRLAGRRVVGRLPVAPGIEAMIFDGTGGGMIAVWNRAADHADAKLNLYLGEHPVAVDVFGNRRELTLVDHRHQLTVGRTPTFIEGIDAELALFRSHFRINEPFIESTQTIHRRELTIHNPWNRTISGRMRIVEPEDWHIQPRLTHFSIGAGETTVVPIAIKFPVSETAGPKRIVAEIDFTADEQYSIEVEAAVDIGLEDVEFESTALLVPNRETGQMDIVVMHLIVNRRAEPITLYAFANLPDHPRQERLISRLAPGQTASRRFTFPAAGDDPDLVDAPIRTGIRQANGPAVLTHIVRPDE